MDTALVYEKSQNGEPKNVSSQRGLGYDIISGNRKIEVKGQEWKWKKRARERESFKRLERGRPELEAPADLTEICF